MKIFIGFTLLGFLLLSCGDSKNLEDSLVDISKFKMDDTALEDGEDVKIIGASGNLTSEDEMDFYNLVVVKSLKTGKTVNVLMPDYIYVDGGNRNVQFISFKGEMGRLIGATKSGSFEKGQNIKDVKPKEYDRVLYDKEFIKVNVYDNPTIIGSLGKITIKQMEPDTL